jgi:hypothetical protein
MCVGKEHIEKLRRNLIFVQRLDGKEECGVSDTYLTIDGIQIPLVLVKTNDYTEVYKALAATKRKIPARILRYCKEQLYELVASSEPERKMAVLDIDSIQDKTDLEFVVGVGVKALAEGEVGAIGYETIEVPDLIHDLLFEDRNYDATGILTSVIKRAGRNSRYVPVHKYLREVGICDEESYIASGLQLEKWIGGDLSDFSLKMYAGQFFKKRHQTIEELIISSTPENAAALIPFLPKDKIKLDILHDFLIEHIEKIAYDKSSYASHFKKLAVIYDRLKWGW